MANVRAGAHVHSDWSYDGTWPLANIARAFALRRYGVVLMAEHDRGFDQDRWAASRRACAEASGDRILLVPGIEYSDRANTVHVAVWGDLPFLGEGRDTGDLLREVERLGGLAVLAHPGRRGAWTLVEKAGVRLSSGSSSGIASTTAGCQLRVPTSSLAMSTSFTDGPPPRRSDPSS
jgi:hypothetical protein